MKIFSSHSFARCNYQFQQNTRLIHFHNNNNDNNNNSYSLSITKMFRNFSISSPDGYHNSSTNSKNRKYRMNQQQLHQIMVHDGDLDESELPSPPEGKAWVKDHDTNVWALMPIPTKANTAVATSGFVDPKWTSKNEENNCEPSDVSADEEDWEMISDHDDDDDEIVSRIKGISEPSKQIPESEESITDSSFVSVHMPNVNSVQSVNSNGGNGSKSLLVPPGGSSSVCSTRSFNSTLLKDVAALAVNSYNNDPSGADEISTLTSLPSIRTTSVAGGSDNADGSNSSSQYCSIEAYVEHIVLPSDTLQGICLSYKISASKLRQVNRFTGNSLLEAPKKLIIPLTRRNVAVGIKQQDQNSKEYKTYYLISECSRKLSKVDAQSILERVNWNVEQAVKEGNSSVDEDKSVSNGDGLSFQIAIQGNVAFPTKFIRSIFLNDKEGGNTPATKTTHEAVAKSSTN